MLVVGTTELKKTHKLQRIRDIGELRTMVHMSGLADLSITMEKGMAGLEAIKEDWVKLYAAQKHPAYHQDWRWMASLQRCLIDQPLNFVVLRRRNQVALILPLHLRSMVKAGISQNYLSFPYHNHVVLSDALVQGDYVEDTDFKEMLFFLETQKEFKWDHLKFSGIYSRSPLPDILMQSGLELNEIASNAYFSLGPERYDVNLSKKFIKNIKRLTTKAANELGDIETLYVNDVVTLPDAFEAFLDLEASGWKGEAGTSTAIKHNPQLVKFYRHLMESFSKDGSFQINLLKIDGVPAAGQMCIRSGGTWFILKIAYNDDLKRFGAGNILMLSFLEALHSEGEITELNLVTSPPWADRWHLNKRPVFSLQYFNKNFKGRLTKVMSHSNKILKGIAKAKGGS